MEQLKYEIDEKIIVELLGKQNFSTKESAILELVKNAYDAQANNLTIIFSLKNKSSLTIIDDGSGMNENDIKTKWMQIGKSDKGYFINEEESNRVYTGEKGIGRFALSRLGNQVELLSKKAGYPQVIWRSDWEKNWLDISECDQKSGTIINLEKLNDRWTPTSIKNLSDYLSKVFNDSSMKITIYDGEKRYEVSPGWPEPDFGNNCVSYIDLEYVSTCTTLICEINSDEFLMDARRLTYPIDINKHRVEINIFDFLNKGNQSKKESTLLQKELKELGNFSARFFFSLDGRSLKGEENPFMYKHKRITNRINQGIILYRNAFSISSYEGRRDWLGLSTRATSSPAAASHPTGGWRVRKHQLSGYVHIDKAENKQLKDLSNRQGLNENAHYSLFVTILQKGINEFERYRQSVIRKISAHKAYEYHDENPIILDAFKKNPKIIKNLNNADLQKLRQEIEKIETTQKDNEEKLLSNEERYKYDVRILNTLSTIGLKASSIAHELCNKRNQIFSYYNNIVKALKEYGLWDELNTPERTRLDTKNVPKILSENNKISNQLLVFMDTLLSDVEKDNFFPKQISVKKELDNVSKIWMADYPWVTITITGDEELEYNLTKDTISVIFDNLILNSIQQNRDLNFLSIDIFFKKNDSEIQFIYADNGSGLCAAYKNDPFLILEPHESSREKGHGLGMWIIHNTIEMLKGHILDIPISQKGFKIMFTLKEISS